MNPVILSLFLIAAPPDTSCVTSIVRNYTHNVREYLISEVRKKPKLSPGKLTLVVDLPDTSYMIESIPFMFTVRCNVPSATVAVVGRPHIESIAGVPGAYLISFTNLPEGLIPVLVSLTAPGMKTASVEKSVIVEPILPADARIYKGVMNYTRPKLGRGYNPSRQWLPYGDPFVWHTRVYVDGVRVLDSAATVFDMPVLKRISPDMKRVVTQVWLSFARLPDTSMWIPVFSNDTASCCWIRDEPGSPDATTPVYDALVVLSPWPPNELRWKPGSRTASVTGITIYQITPNGEHERLDTATAVDCERCRALSLHPDIVRESDSTWTLIFNTDDDPAEIANAISVATGVHIGVGIQVKGAWVGTKRVGVGVILGLAK